MPYMSLGERIGLEKGRQEGRQEGEGLLLRRLLTQKFGPLPPDIEAKLTEASIAELEAWGDRLLQADSLASIFEA
jgi:predicted transposase YdaD